MSKKDFKEIGMHLQMIYVDDKVVKYMVFIFMYFLPRINLLTLRCFVAEVRWLFPVNRQEYRESTKQQNIEPWWELKKNAAITKISATCASFKYCWIFDSQSSVPVHCLLGFACFLFHIWQLFCKLFIVYMPTSREHWNRVKKMNIPNTMTD